MSATAVKSSFSGGNFRMLQGGKAGMTGQVVHTEAVLQDVIELEIEATRVARATIELETAKLAHLGRHGKTLDAILERAGLPKDTIVPTSEGGVDAYFFAAQANRFASVSVD